MERCTAQSTHSSRVHRKLHRSHWPFRCSDPLLAILRLPVLGMRKPTANSTTWGSRPCLPPSSSSSSSSSPGCPSLAYMMPMYSRKSRGSERRSSRLACDVSGWAAGAGEQRQRPASLTGGVAGSAATRGWPAVSGWAECLSHPQAAEIAQRSARSQEQQCANTRALQRLCCSMLRLAMHRRTKPAQRSGTAATPATARRYSSHSTHSSPEAGGPTWAASRSACGRASSRNTAMYRG